MNGLEDIPEDDVMVYNFHFNHNHTDGLDPLVILKTTKKIKNHHDNRNKWYGLVRYVTGVLRSTQILTGDDCNWVYLFDNCNRPNGHDNCYMKEFCHDHFFNILCYSHDNPALNVSFRMFTDNTITRMHLLKYNRDFDFWESVISLEDIEHEEG